MQKKNGSLSSLYFLIYIYIYERANNYDFITVEYGSLSPQITKNLPTSVINRIRRNCSDRIDDDKIFKDTMIDYKVKHT